MPDEKRVVRREIWLVLGVSLGYSAVYALLDLVGKLTAGKGLAVQHTVMNASRFPGRPWLDLGFQLVGILFGVVPALLAVHLLEKDSKASLLGFKPLRLGFDSGFGFFLAALIGLPGLGFYFAAHALGINTTVVPEALPVIWWTVPVLVLAAVQNAFLEEVIVVGYLTTRLRELGWSLPMIVAASALLRGSYHLYQGFGGFLGNLVMGLVFALFFLRFKRIGPLIFAHSVIDACAFVGYYFLHSHWTML